MFNKYLAGAAGLAAIAAGSVQAAEDSGAITLSLTVEKIIVLTVEDADIELTASDIGAGVNDTAGMDHTNPEARAEFSVMSNTDYQLAVTVPNTWAHSVNTAYRQVRFDNTDAASSAYIGGSIFLDEDPDTPQSGNTGLRRWNGATGSIASPTYSAGADRYGLGVEFSPQLWGDGGTEQEGIAPVGTYSTVATVTASTL